MSMSLKGCGQQYKGMDSIGMAISGGCGLGTEWHLKKVGVYVLPFSVDFTLTASKFRCSRGGIGQMHSD